MRKTTLSLIFLALIVSTIAWSFGIDDDDDDDDDEDEDHGGHHGHDHEHFPHGMDLGLSHRADHDDEYHRDEGREETEGIAKDKVKVITFANINAFVSGIDSNSEKHAQSENHEAEHHSHDEFDHDDGSDDLDSTHHHTDDHDDDDEEHEHDHHHHGHHGHHGHDDDD